MDRACGILLPIFSLPGNYGIGCFSVKAYEFVDTLKKAGQTYWQILPLGPTGYGDSPYQPFSSFAGNPYFVDLDELAAKGWLKESDLKALDWGRDPRYVDYGKIWENREKTLKKAYGNFLESASKEDRETYEEELKKLNPETETYCLYRAIKNSQGGKNWQEWEDGLRLRKPEAMEGFRMAHREDIDFQVWIQVMFRRQWKMRKKSANVPGIRIIGDLPIYVSQDSADAWAHPELFCFDKDGRPETVAGCPPDYFSPDGQLWGNPLYDWKYHKKTGYAWWMNRMDYTLELYDYVRLDHFRGFDEYYSIPASARNAKEGKWLPGPGMDFFKTMEKHFKGRFDDLPIIAEDLGLLTDSVLELLDDTDFPGMKVLEFAFDSDSRNLYLPHNYVRNCVAYTGTHDNAPLCAWLKELNGSTRLHMIRYQGGEHTPEHDLFWDCIRTVLGSVADTAIIPMWDYLGAGKEARVNTPSSAHGNWRWRLLQGEFNDNLVWHCGMLAEIYSRERKAPEVPKLKK